MILHLSKKRIGHVLPGLWAWVRFKPGTRPRRMARQLVVGIAAFVIARPPYAIFIKRLLAPFPSLKNRLRPSVLDAVHQDLTIRDFSDVDNLDMSAEPESVREIYRRLFWIRKLLLETE